VWGEWGEDRPVPGANRHLITPLPRGYASTYAAGMPVIVIGGDTPLGTTVLEALVSHDRDVRVFVTDPVIGTRFRDAGVRVAVGDVSDGSHVSGAAAGCFSAVLVTDATADRRERSFAADADEVLEIWAAATVEAGVQRAIWVGRRPKGAAKTPETALIEIDGRSPPDIAAEISDLDDRPLL